METGSDFVLTTPLDSKVDYEEIDESNYSQTVQSSAKTALSQTDPDVCLIELLDTAGQEEYSSLREQWTRSGDAFFIVYSVTSIESWEEAQNIYAFCCRVRGTDSVPAVIAANKSDLLIEEVVPFEDVCAWGRMAGVPVIRTSAKTGMNVETAFIKLVEITPRRTANNQYVFTVLGGGGVGKSSLSVKFTLDVFIVDYDPTIEDSYRKMIRVEGISKKWARPPNANAAPFRTCGAHARRRTSIFKSISSIFVRNDASRDDPPPAYSEPSGSSSSQVKRAEKKAAPQQKVRKVPMANTNIIFVNLGSLAPENFSLLEINNLDRAPPSCTSCNAVLGPDPVCAFCGLGNGAATQLEVRRSAEEYVLVKGVGVAPKDTPLGPFLHLNDTGLTIFCVDVSGSMNFTHEVNQMQGLWEGIKQGRQGLSTSPAVKMVTRLQCMKDAMHTQFDRLNKHFPNRRVAILAFSSSVDCFFFDDTGVVTKKVASQDITSLSQGMERGASLIPRYWAAVDKCYDRLRSCTNGLSTDGSTAIGTALALALGLAKAHRFLSASPTEIFLCTDGASNSGIGANDGQYAMNKIAGTPNRTSRDHGRAFYSDAGEAAAKLGAKINIIGIAGEGVALDVLSIAATASGGLKNIVDVNELRREMRTATQKRVVAKDISLVLYAPRGWRFATDARSGATVSSDGNTLMYTRAQAADATSVSFAFTPHKKQGQWTNDVVPLQARITYTSPISGDTRVRILHRVVPTTVDRKHAERGAHVSAVGTHILQQIGEQMSTLLTEGSRGWNGAKQQAAIARDTLYAFNKLSRRAAVSMMQQEELAGFVTESAAIDKAIESTFGPHESFPRGVTLDDAVRTFARYSDFSREEIGAGSNKGAKVMRAAALV